MSENISDKSPSEVHILIRTEEYRRLLEESSVSGCAVTEIGVGTGVLTQLILDHEPDQVIGFEIVDGLCAIKDPRLVLHLQDFSTADFSYLADGRRHCLISNPPYSLLTDIAEILQKYERHLSEVILMVRPKDLGLFPGFSVAFELPAEAFTPPPTSNRHLVIKKEFTRGESVCDSENTSDMI